MTKLEICGICGGKSPLKCVDDDFVATGHSWCLKCGNEVIPLVTPQEERTINRGSFAKYVNENPSG